MAYKRLGDLLVAAGTLNNDELNRGLSLQKEQGGRLGEVLIRNKIITEQQLVEALQMQLGIEFVDLSKVNIPTELAQVVPRTIARAHQVVPVRIRKGELYLAMVDPMNFYAIEEVRKAVRKKIVPMIATADGVSHAIATLYGNEGAAKAIEEMKREQLGSGDAQEQQDLAFIANQIDSDSVNSAPTIRLVNSIIERAVTERASDIHMEPRENEFQVRMRIDGVMRNILTVPKELQNPVISRVKIMSGLDIAERRIPQDGRFNVQSHGKDIDLRVSTLPTVYGEKIVARLLDKSGGTLTKEAIGLAGSDLEKYEKMIHCHSGVVLVTGPTGSGKSSTMYTMIGELNTEEVNLVTLEDPVEYNVDGVNQVQINDKVGMTFASGLRSILRQDPDIIAVGEIRDGETADIAMRAAITGHTVLSTIHTNDSIGTIDRLIDIGCEPYLVASALKGVIAQRLVRRICPQCRQAYDPTPEELESLGLDPANEVGTMFYRGAGCANCFDTGYRGRIGVFEVLPINMAMRDAIVNRAQRKQLEEIARADGLSTLQESALRLIREGTTTVSEALRVTNEES